MKLLVVGSGGREHAMSWKLAQDPSVDRVFVAPGNPGMDWDRKIESTGIPAVDFAKIAAFVKEKEISFVVVGPDQALADGIVDFLEERGIPAFGPSKEASKIEWSKTYSKELMKASGIPTAKYEVFEDAAKAKAFLETVEWGNGWVIKADGLALGKGVVVCDSREQAISTVGKFLGGSMGEAGKKIVVEERLRGREVSAFFLCDGVSGAPLGMACDYKRIFDGDEGPNTGGMGAFSPADWLPEGFLEKVSIQVTKPLLAEMRKRKNPFKGVLFIGLMVDEGAGKVLEFNARFGDPETQVLLPMIDEPLYPWLAASREGTLSKLPSAGPAMKKGSGVHVVFAAKGYPGTPTKGDEIKLDPLFGPGSETWRTESVKIFFAGVAKQGPGLCTNGGRVLGITAMAGTRSEARKKAYEWAAKASFAGSRGGRMSGSKTPMPFVVLASGAGSNCAVLLEHAKKNPQLLQAKAVISDRSGAPALDVAAKLGVETFVVSHRDEGPLLALLRKLQPRWACLAGYKRLVGNGFLEYFGDEGFSRVLNVHPSLLPAYPGLNGYERAYKDGVKVSGVTVHLVDSGLDTGLAVLQESFARQDGDTLDAFIARGREVEHRLFPRALELAASGNLKMKNENGNRWISGTQEAGS